MTGNKGVATAVAAPTIEQRIGNGATLLGGGVAVLMCRCGVPDASLRRRVSLSGRGDGVVARLTAVLLHLCSTSSLCGRLAGVARLATVRSINVDRGSMFEDIDGRVRALESAPSLPLLPHPAERVWLAFVKTH